MAQAARAVCERLNPDFIDLNFGCPSPRVTGSCAGSALLKDLPQLEKITSAAVNAVGDKIPVTAKTRLGWDSEHIVIDEVLIVEGKVSYDDFTGGLRVVADKLMTIGEARARFAKHLLLRMNGGSDTRKLKSLLSPFAPGPALVRIRYRNETAECEMVLGDAIRVRLDDMLLDALSSWLKPENIEIVYH